MADAPDAIFRLPATPGDRLVLVLLWRYAAAGERAPVVWPSAARLAEQIGFQERAVRRSLATLAAMGAISRCVRPSSVLSKGKAWRLHPDPPVTVTDRSPCHTGHVDRDPPATGPTGHPDPLVTPDPDPPVLNTLTSGSSRSPIEAPIEAPADPAPAQDPRLALAAAIDAQTERYELAKREHPPARMGEGVAGTLETATLRERFVGILERFPAGTPERARLAACRLATPIPEVLRRTCEDLGGLERVADVLAWAWTEHAHGRLTFAKGDPAQALRDVFRGEGRWWPGILDAYTRRPGEQRSLAWRPPDVGDEPRASAEFLNASMERFR